MTDDPGADALEEQLRRLAAAREPVPPDLLAAAVDAFGWRDIDAELAALVYDSLAEAGEAALVRGAAGAAGQRLISFHSGGFTIDVEVTRDGPTRSLLGQITPPREWLVELRGPGGLVTVTADDLGRFRSDGLAPGPLSLRLRGAPGSVAAIVTDWVSI